MPQSELNLSGCLRAVVGLVLVPIVHIPKFVWLLAHLSYAGVFRNRPNLTADPQEHLRRARRLLKRRHNALLLYAALELRFAVERRAQTDLYIRSITNRARKEYDPVKKIDALRRAEPESAAAHSMVMVNRKTGAEVDFGNYKPLDRTRVSEIQGRLGDLLHPKVGLPLGIPDSPWYLETRAFLWETHDYLTEVCKDRTFYLGGSESDDVWQVKRVPQ